MNTMRGCCGMLMSYDWIPIPLVYTQVVSIAVYAFCVASLFGRQYVDTRDSAYGDSCKFFPFFTFVQLFFYMGWLKVAEALINPLGEDDDDFELNYLIDRNIQALVFKVGFTMVDELHGKYPKLTHDPFWGDDDPQVPYTEASAFSEIDPYLGSTVDISVPEGGREWAVYDPGPINPGDLRRRKLSTANTAESGSLRRVRSSLSNIQVEKMRRKRAPKFSVVSEIFGRRLSRQNSWKASTDSFASSLYGGLRGNVVHPELGRTNSNDTTHLSVDTDHALSHPAPPPSPLSDISMPDIGVKPTRSFRTTESQLSTIPEVQSTRTSQDISAKSSMDMRSDSGQDNSEPSITTLSAENLAQYLDRDEDPKLRSSDSVFTASAEPSEPPIPEEPETYDVTT